MAIEQDYWNQMYANACDQNEVLSLRQQLATREAQIVMLRKQVSADVTQILKLLDVIDSVRGPTGATEGIQEHAQHIEKVALAATDDLDGLILCHAEEVAFFYEHAVTKETVLSRILDDECAERGWNTTPLYRAWEPK